KQPELIPAGQRGRIIPVYKGKEKIVSPITIEEKITTVLRDNCDDAVHLITSAINVSEKRILEVASPNFSSLKDLLLAIHRPKVYEDVISANRSVRLINAFH